MGQEYVLFRVVENEGVIGHYVPTEERKEELIHEWSTQNLPEPDENSEIKVDIKVFPVSEDDPEGDRCQPFLCGHLSCDGCIEESTNGCPTCGWCPNIYCQFWSDDGSINMDEFISEEEIG